LINQTSTIVVLMCIPALLTRLMSGSYEEAIQLTGNRLCERVYLPSPPADEILMMLERRGVKFADVMTKNTVAKSLAEDAPHFGNWRYVIQITRKLYEAAKKAPVVQATFSKACADVKAMRTRIVKQQEA
jgi:hypothetical protein